MKLFSVLFFSFNLVALGSPATHTLAFEKNHVEEWPKEVLLVQPTPFTVVMDGKEVGSVTVPAQTIVRLVSVNEGGLQLEFSKNLSTVAPELTDFWDRVETVRKNKDSISLQTPAAQLQLPINSVSPNWYQDQTQKLLDPWLQTYPSSSAFDRVTALKETFAVEAGRVTGGEVRRGDRWYSAAEARENRATFDLEDLQLQLNSPDTSILSAALPNLKKYQSAIIHPHLLHLAINSINGLVNSATPDPLKPRLVQSLPTLVAQAEAEDGALAKLEEAKTKLAAEDGIGALPLLKAVDAAWPGSDILYSFCLEQTNLMLEKCLKAEANGDIPRAIALYDTTVRITQGASPLTPLPKSLIRSIIQLNPDFQAAATLQRANQAGDEETVLDTRFDTLPETIKAWGTKLQQNILAPREKSKETLSLAKSKALHLNFKGALATFQLAKAFWPANPEIVQDLHIVDLIQISACVVLVLLLLLSPFLWNVGKTLLKCYLPLRFHKKPTLEEA